MNNRLYALLTIPIAILFFYLYFKFIVFLLKKLFQALPIKISIEFGKNPEDKLRKP